MANFPKAYPAIGRSVGLQGAKGAAGAAGAAGNGAVFTAVDSLTASPRTVTDWGAILNTAMAAGTRAFQFGPFDYPFTTQIVFGNVRGVVFQGTNGWYWNTFGGSQSRLVYTGGGSGVGSSGAALTQNFSATNDMLIIRDLAIVHTNKSFTGDLTYFHAVGMERCTLYGEANQLTASALANLGNTVYCKFTDCIFGGALTLINGGRSTDSPGAGFSNVVKFDHCVFQGTCVQQVSNPNLDWLFDHCTHEMVTNSLLYLFTTDHVFPNGNQFHVREAQFWDAGPIQWSSTFTYNLGDQAQVGGATNYVSLVANNLNNPPASSPSQWAVGTLPPPKYFYQPPTHNWQLIVEGCWDHNSIGAHPFADLQGNGEITLRDNFVGADAYVDCGNAVGDSTRQKSMINITGNRFFTAGSTVLLRNHMAGHLAATVQGNAPPNLEAMATIGHERVDQSGTGALAAPPAIALHTGITSLTFTVVGTDTAGFIIIRNTAGSPSSTGLIADVTLTDPPVSTIPSQPASQFPMVMLSPATVHNGAYLTADAGQSAKCGAYIDVTSTSGVANQGLFSLGVSTAIPATTNIGYFYRILHM